MKNNNLRFGEVQYKRSFLAEVLLDISNPIKALYRIIVENIRMILCVPLLCYGFIGFIHLLNDVFYCGTPEYGIVRIILNAGGVLFICAFTIPGIITYGNVKNCKRLQPVTMEEYKKIGAEMLYDALLISKTISQYENVYVQIWEFIIHDISEKPDYVKTCKCDYLSICRLYNKKFAFKSYIKQDALSCYEESDAYASQKIRKLCIKELENRHLTKGYLYENLIYEEKMIQD